MGSPGCQFIERVSSVFMTLNAIVFGMSLRWINQLAGRGDIRRDVEIRLKRLRW
jgi:hypothetical protein